MEPSTHNVPRRSSLQRYRSKSEERKSTMKLYAAFAIAFASCSLGVNAFVQPPSLNSNVCAARIIDTSNSSLLGYLDNLGGATATKTKKGIANYLDSVATTPSRTGGAGIGNYLDSIHKACDTNQPTTKCAEAITNYMGALSNGAASPSSSSEGANAIGSYLDHLAGARSSHSGGAGIPSYLSTVATSPSRIGGGGITSYLNGAHLVNGASAPSNTKSAPAVKVSKIHCGSSNRSGSCKFELDAEILCVVKFPLCFPLS